MDVTRKLVQPKVEFFGCQQACNNYPRSALKDYPLGCWKPAERGKTNDAKQVMLAPGNQFGRRGHGKRRTVA
jgi:hypothetical protein